MAATNFTRVTVVSSQPPVPHLFKMRPILHKLGAR